ncbi:MAG: hypothetical protein E6J90_33595 [Deltaproteobacteria bacterium]|nr:MAG: hypothetical protein E6J91_43895 [Deltaproteobacteria bacterium]TMQ11781.1 MAG: hypothetical protein E6J90_33595 [Deltaproteobacteria bacterium]
MTDQDDAAELTEISRELPALDLDATTTERIAHRARDQVGRRPSPLRFVEPAIAALLVTGYLIWAVLKALEALGG